MEKKTKNSCYTYFRITGSFDPDEISAMLQLAPERQWKIGDYKKDGIHQFDFASWEIGKCTKYDFEVANQMRKTIAPLVDKIEQLRKIHSAYDVSFWLEIVPSVFADDETPCLAPTMDIIDFCHETRTEIDIDLYLFRNDEE